MADIHTHYDNLKVARNAPVSVIKAAYKALCQSYHPDKFQGSKEEAERIMKLINTAYEVLIDPVKRAEHDRWIDNQRLKDALFSEAEEEQYSKRQNIQRESNRPSQPPPESKQSKSSTPIYSWLRWVVFVVCCFGLLLIHAGWRTYDHTHGGSGVGGFLRGVIIFVPLAALWRWAKSGNKLKNSSDPQQYPHEPPSGFPSGKGWLFWIGAIVIVIWLYSKSDNQNTVPSQASYPSSPAVINSPPPSMQSTPPSSNSDEDMYKRAVYFRDQGMYAEALPLVRQLVEKGYSGAQIELGGMYENGQGVTQDYTQAIYWYRKASETADVNQEIAKAALNSAISKTNKEASHQVQQPSSTTIAEDTSQPINDLYSLKKAAAQGDAKAQFELGVMYGTGQGVPLDYNLSLYWYKQAEQSRLRQ